MDTQRVEEALKSARGLGGPEGEFEALQDLVNALLLQQHSIGKDIDCIGSDFYHWYLRRLMMLYKELVALRNNGPLYHMSDMKDRNIIIARIEAALYTIPGIERLQN